MGIVHKAKQHMRRSLLTLMTILTAASTLVAAPLMSGTAYATGCHHNQVNPGDWGTPFNWTSPINGFTYKLYPSPLKQTGGSSSSCNDINVQSVTDSCSSPFVGYWIQIYNPSGHNYYGPTNNNDGTSGFPVLSATDNDPSVDPIDGPVLDNLYYRIDLEVQPGCTASTNTTPILD